MADIEALKSFLSALDDADIERCLEDEPLFNDLMCQAEKIGLNLEEAAKDFFQGKQKLCNPSNVLPPSTIQAAYIAPEEETPLYNVMTDGRKPFWQKSKDIFKSMSFGVQDWDLKLTAKDDKRKYSLLCGEHIGAEVRFEPQGLTEKRLEANYNVRNQKLQARYTTDNPVYNFSTSIFTKSGNVGTSVSFYRKPEHVGTSFSVDKENMAASLNWHKNNAKYDCKFSLYGNYSFNNREDNVVGISLTIMSK